MVDTLLKLGFPHEDIVAGLQYKWPYKCEGLTEKEIKELGYIVDDKWLVEEK